jgi:hypothetical protein
MARPRVKKEFPHYQMSEWELAEFDKIEGFERETQVLEARYPYLDLKPVLLGNRPSSNVAVADLDPRGHQGLGGDIRWTYDDRSDLGGKGHFAFKNIKPGEVIIRVGHPLVSVPGTPRLAEICSNCFLWEPGSDIADSGNDQVGLKACMGCRVVKYCGKVS